MKTLSGFTRFAYTAPKEGRIVSDGYSINFLKCIAELTFSDQEHFILHTKEFFPDTSMMYREIKFVGEMHPNNRLKLKLPEKWVELGPDGMLQEKNDILNQIRKHTGMDIFGEGINKNTLHYMGYFDGKKLFAHTHMVGSHTKPGDMDFFKDILDGPIMIDFMIDLTIS